MNRDTEQIDQTAAGPDASAYVLIGGNRNRRRP